MLFLVTLFFVIALFVFIYHYERNGTPLNLGVVLSRVSWAGVFAGGYALLALDNLDFLSLGWYGLGTFISMLIPHAFAQNMGRWPVPWSTEGLVKYWPGVWLPSYTTAEWDALKPSKRTRIDFLGMLSVGVLRGIVVFVPPIFFGGPIFGSLIAGAITALWQPFSYLAGVYVPFNLFGNAKNSAQWGEFFIGIGWALALASVVAL